jgi:hypothetical protein
MIVGIEIQQSVGARVVPDTSSSTRSDPASAVKPARSSDNEPSVSSTKTAFAAGSMSFVRTDAGSCPVTRGLSPRNAVTKEPKQRPGT